MTSRSQDNDFYYSLIRQPGFLDEMLRSDLERVIRCHIVFETVHGEGSRAKIEPTIGRAILSNISGNEDYRRLCANIKKTISTYD